ncbi:MAG: hypothetical protein M3436_12100 [Pseudomonadota bacterium]|nr:hypothetical protein [Pseudomonadota bacterium]
MVWSSFDRSVKGVLGIADEMFPKIGEKRLAPIGVDGEEIAVTRHMGTLVASEDIIAPSWWTWL